MPELAAFRSRSAVMWLAIALLVGCGAKTGLGVPEELARPRDAGRDAGRLVIPDAGPGFDGCRELRLEWTVTPTVLLLVDQSGSMAEELPTGTTRWDAVEEAFFGGAGLVTRLDRSIRFGLALYSARSRDEGEGGPPIGPCPLMTIVPPALGSHDAIAPVYAMSEPIEDTPTGDAITAVVTGVLADTDTRRGPVVIVLATDGDPDTCAQLDPQEGQAESVLAAENAFLAGIRTFVIGVGDSGLSSEHLQDVANAGVGRDPFGPPAPFWRTNTIGGLRSALDDIVRGELACELLLDQPLDLERACAGSVRLNGRPLRCDDEDGFRLGSPTRLEILGSACEELNTDPSAVLEIVFPCDAG
jgi:hypothetical protein